MSPENIKTLNAYRHHWEAWRDLQMFNQLDYSVREALLRVIREEFDPGYLTNLWCSPCVVGMLKLAYTQYDKYLESVQNKTQE
jgi:hypothetical protein